MAENNSIRGCRDKNNDLYVHIDDLEETLKQDLREMWNDDKFQAEVSCLVMLLQFVKEHQEKTIPMVS